MKSFRPRTVALIGGDGAGKTTLARMLVESEPRRFRYLYMGVNVESSNVALPTSRIISALKRRRPSKPGSPRRLPTKAALPSGRRSRMGNALRLINRIAEEWFRQMVSWHHQIRGRIVICDRHFLFDFALELDRCQSLPLWRRLHLWMLHKLYPSPGLAIFLDAPPQTLLARKNEASAEWLAAHRLAVLRLGMNWPNFHCVNADRPLPQVYLDVAQTISRCWPAPKKALPKKDPQGQWALRLSRARNCLKQGYRRFLLLAVDAALTTGLRRRPSIPQAARALADPGVRNYDKASALANLANRVLPLSAALSRWMQSERLPLPDQAVPMAFGSGATVYRFDSQGGSRVLKILRRSLGLSSPVLLRIAQEYRGKHRQLCSLYNRRSPLVLPSHFLVLNGPLLGQPAVAVVQPCIEGKKTDFYLDHSDEQLMRFFEQDAQLRHQFTSFASATLDCYSKGDWCLDIVGRDNLILVEQGGRRRLAVADCGIFDLKAIRRNAPQRTALFEKRIQRTRRILERISRQTVPLGRLESASPLAVP